MARQPVQVLVLPFREASPREYEFLILKRTDQQFWQGISGGLEDDETPERAAQREAFEEANISIASKLFKLDMFSSLPARLFKARINWSEDILIVPEYYFAIDTGNQEIKISSEHSEFKWCKFEEAESLLRFDANKVGLWELQQRLTNELFF